MKTVDVVVVGAGIAGLSAAIYLKRSSLSLVLLEKMAPGGKLLNIHEIDNYPALGSVSGPELANKAFEQCNALGVDYQYGNVMSIEKQGDVFYVTTDMERYEAKAVIIAVGTEKLEAGVPGENEFNGRGVSYCATCDGNFFKGKEVAVIGYKDQAAEEAIYLAGLASRCYFINPKPLEAAESHLEVLKGKENVVMMEAELLRIEGDKLVNKIVVKSGEEEKEIPVSGVFPLYGEKSAASFLAPLGVELERGFMVCDANMNTNVPGLYGAGDIVAKKLRQVVTAASDGALAATSAIGYVHMLRKK
ncbi:MAG: FAD-dependent oxidoreductase [Candidatus Enteromonas sp.]|nr:FAD-dependent oxidoreductase [Candidatus Enteromonas sp.]